MSIPVAEPAPGTGLLLWLEKAPEPIVIVAAGFAGLFIRGAS